jgi:hypothetical protein
MQEMGIISAFLGAIGGICGIIGVLVGADVLRGSGLATVGSTFWLLLAGVLLLGCIAFLMARVKTGGGD